MKVTSLLAAMTVITGDGQQAATEDLRMEHTTMGSRH